MKQWYDVYCHECSEFSEVHEENLKFDMIITCPHCNKNAAIRIPSHLNLMGSAAYRDGFKRPGFEDLKRAADIDIAAAELPVEARGELLKEKAERLESAKKEIK